MAAVVSPIAGTRVEPKDSYSFVRGSAATFKITFMNSGVPTKVDLATSPTAYILEPLFLNKTGALSPVVLATLTGSLVPGQEYEYQFVWNIPADSTSLDEYVISYSGILGGTTYNFGDEFFTILANAGQIGLQVPGYATVSDVRMAKFNIDDYLPETTRKDVTARNNLLQYHLNIATSRIREELNLHRSRSNTENYKLFCVYYTIWSVLLAASGEDGSSVANDKLQFYRAEWQRILEQEKRRSVAQGISWGRA